MKLIFQLDQYLKRINGLWFILVFSSFTILIKFPGGLFGAILALIFGIDGGVMDADMQLPTFEPWDLFGAGVIAPIVETFTGQYLPIKICSWFSKSEIRQIVVSAAVFSLMHLPVVEFLPTAFLIGLLLAWAYKIKQQNSNKQAFFYTAVIHSMTNMLPLALLFGFAVIFQLFGI